MEKKNKDEIVGASTSRPRYPPGYRFMPTDRELILEYLAKRVKDEPVPVEEISEVNLYEHCPRYLADNYPYLGFEHWYFFTPRDRRYPKGSRPSRSVEDLGYWKATGSDKPIKSAEGAVVGFKKTLVFYEFEGEDRKKIKTNWIMHEYKLNVPSKSPNSIDMKLDDWVLCRIYDKDGRSSYRKQMDAEEDDVIVAQPLVNNDVALNIVDDVGNNYIGPLVDNNPMGGAMRENHVDHGQWNELNYGYLGQQNPATSTYNFYQTGQVLLPDTSFQNPYFNDDMLQFQYMYDFSSNLSGNCFMQFDDRTLDHYPWPAPAPAAETKLGDTNDGTHDDQHMGLKRKKFC